MANSQPDQTIFAALEVCRSRPADLTDPDLAYVAAAIELDPRLGGRLARIQRTDEQLARALGDVAVPADLEQRLLSGLAQSDGVATNAAETEFSRPTATRRHSNHRLFWASVAAVAASIAAAFFLLPSTAIDQATRPETLLNDAMAFFNSETPALGLRVSEEAPPVQFAASGDVRHVASARWRKIDDFLGFPAVAYDLTSERGEQATLYVARRRLAQLEMVTMPSPEPWLATGDMAATCWQNDDLLFVLVVAGGLEQYEAFVRQPGSTIAFVAPAPARLAQAS